MIDERILIPSGAGVVWQVISDLNKNPIWQVDCQDISFLSSRRVGPGARWRYVSASGNEYVVETTAWYDGLGYEYTFIDGTPFNQSVGRIRLQEIAEGTVVQWSLNYQTAGMLSGLRDTLATRRHFEKTMIESLRSLYTHVKQTDTDPEAQSAKSLMRDALNYEARAQYVSRHPSRVAQHEATELSIAEPPIADDDTRPNPVVVATEPTDNAPASQQPTTPDKPDTLPAAEPTAAKADQKPPVDSDHTRFKPPDHSEPAAEAIETEQAAPDIDTPEPAIPAQKPEQPEPAAAAQIDTTPAAAQPPASDDPLGPIIDTSDMDTKEISIWQVFGMDRPSDTRPMEPVTIDEDEDETASADSPLMAPESAESPAVESAKETKEIAPPQPISASTITGKAKPAPAKDEVLTNAEDTPEAVAMPATRPAIKLGPLEPIPPLPHGFRLQARSQQVKLRRRR